MKLSGHEINSQHRQKLEMPTGRHMYVVLGTYERIERYERIAFREARSPSGQPFRQVGSGPARRSARGRSRSSSTPAPARPRRPAAVGHGRCSARSGHLHRHVRARSFGRRVTAVQRRGRQHLPLDAPRLG